MKPSLLKYTPEFILLIYLILFFGIKKPYEDFDRVINSDGKGYYGYLTAIFIYHDLDYSFVEEYEKNYYPPDGTAFKEFRMPFKGQTVNKTFPGLALLWLPFFLIAHFLSLITGTPADGYSIIYQYSIGFATLFYLWLGSKYLFKIAQLFGAKLKDAAFITIAVVLGTNLTYYAIVEPSMGHVFSFCLFTIFTFYSIKAFHEDKLGYYIIATIAYSIVIIIRPTNAVFILLLIFIAKTPNELGQKFMQFFRHPKAVFFSLLVFTFIIFIPPALWYLHSGYFFVWSYGDEGFNFADPYFISILFSYNKGWFIYTPIAFIAMFGFIKLFQQSKFQFWGLLILLTLHIYITSSWWVWHYTSKFSQRVFIDFYVVLGILLVFLFMLLDQNKIIKKLLISLISILILFNLFQFYQHSKWVFPYGYITKDIYWDSFLRTIPQAKVYIPKDKIINTIKIDNDFEESKGWNNEICIKSDNGNNLMRLDSLQIYSAEFRQVSSPLFETSNQIIKITADIKSNLKISKASLVVEFQCNSFSYSYNSFYLGNYNKKNNWVKMEYAIYIPERFTNEDMLKIFYFNPDKNEVLEIDNMEIEFISLIEEKELLDGIDLAETNTIKHAKYIFKLDPSNPFWGNTACFSDSTGVEKPFCLINKDNPYSLTFEAFPKEIDVKGKTCIIINAGVLATNPETATRLIADIPVADGQNGYFPIFIAKKINAFQWSNIETVLNIDNVIASDKPIKIYFWNPSASEKVYISNMKIQILSF
jgi:hypothetical protein